jgi:phage baseplate assembly protein W
VLTIDPNRFGSDLRLLRDLERQNDRNPGSDLFVTVRDTTGLTDLETLNGVLNLQQALLLRIRTRMGELAPLGHPDYGSQLYTLIGELNNDANRNRAKLFVLQALGAEPRIKSIQSVTVTQNKSEPTRMDISASLAVIDSDTLLNLVFPFFLEGGPTQ